MLSAGTGLTEVPTDELRRLLRYVHRDELPCPLMPEALARFGFQDRSEPLMATMRGLDQAGVRAILVAVIAERLPANRQRRTAAEMGIT